MDLFERFSQAAPPQPVSRSESQTQGLVGSHAAGESDGGSRKSGCRSRTSKGRLLQAAGMCQHRAIGNPPQKKREQQKTG